MDYGFHNFINYLNLMILSMCIKACSRELKWETLIIDVDVKYRILSILEL